MRVLLADSDKHDGLSSGIDHVQCGSHFLIHCVEFGQDDAVDSTRVRILDSVVNETLVKLS